MLKSASHTGCLGTVNKEVTPSHTFFIQHLSPRQRGSLTAGNGAHPIGHKVNRNLQK